MSLLTEDSTMGVSQVEDKNLTIQPLLLAETFVNNGKWEKFKKFNISFLVEGGIILILENSNLYINFAFSAF